MRFALHFGWAAAPDRLEPGPDASPQAINEPTK